MASVLFDYKMMDSTNTLVGAATIISKAANNTQLELAGNHPSEHRPLLDQEGSQHISSPVKDGVPEDAANQKTNSHEVVRSNDIPITTEPVPVLVQPSKTDEDSLYEELHESQCCGCDEMYCNCSCGERSCKCGKTPDGYRCVIL